MTTNFQRESSLDDIDAELGEHYYRGDKATEEQWTAAIIDLIRQSIDRRFQQEERPARRDAHTFDSGCVKAIFQVDADLDPALQHGVFVPGREYEAWIRFSNGDIEPRSRWIPDARGMAIKLVGVKGPKLIDDETLTQDFVLISHPVYFVDDLERYSGLLAPFLKRGLFDHFVRSLIPLQWRERWLATVANLRWISNPLFHQYWSMTPYRLGVDPRRKTAVKYTAKPRMAPAPKSLLNRLTHRIDLGIQYLARDFSLKNEMNRTLARMEMLFDFYVQRYVDESTPVEDSTVEWRESVARLEHVAKIIIPSQEVLASDRDWFCENLSYNPWHALPEHKPLGLINRVRKKVYVEISNHRHALNGVQRKEPSSNDR